MNNIDHDFTLFYNYDPTDPPRCHHRVADADYFDWLFDSLAGTGVTFLYRCNLAGRAYYHSQVMAPFDESCVDPSHEAAPMWRRVVDMMCSGDPLARAVKAARKHGVPIWVWWNWNEFQNIRRGCLYLVDPVWYEKPRKYWTSRDGSRFYHGVPDFGDGEVRQRLLDLLGESTAYGVDGMYLSTRSHSWFACYPSPGWDTHLEDFGFNDSTVELYRERHGIDIRYENYDRDTFLCVLGDQFSELIQQSGAALHDRDIPFVVGLSPDRYNLMGMGDQWPGKKHLQLYKDWETWSREGWIDGLCCEQTCPRPGQPITAADAIFRDTLPNDFPLYAWGDTAYFNNRGLGPFHMGNWDPITVDELIALIDRVQADGAAGIFLHSLYHYTSCDTAGKALPGYGVLPRTEYLDALRVRQATL